MDNQLFVRQLVLTPEQVQDKPATLISDWLSNETFLYSYYIKCKVTNGIIEQYTIKIAVSQTDRYNTVPVPEAILGMIQALNSNSKEFVIGYQQPPLDVMIEAFTPLVQSLARCMAIKWHKEYEDMVQTCYLCMVTLYNKGYYLNRSLLTSTFVNEVLQGMKDIKIAVKNGYKGTVSLDSPVTGYDGITVEGMIKDEEQELMFETMEEEDYRKYDVKRKRDLAIKALGKRKYNSLLAAMETGTITGSDRSTMYRAGKRLRNKL